MKGTLDHGIFFPADSHLESQGFVDADWAQDLDKRKSTMGMVFKLGSSTIQWSGKLQPTIALSSIEAEYKALADGAQQMVWLRALLAELGQDIASPTPLHCDNQRALKLEDSCMERESSV